MNYRKPTGEDRKKTAIYLAVYIAAISVTAFLIKPSGVYGVVIWVAIILSGLYLLVRWHARNTAYRCANCGHVFEICFFTDLISPHGTGNGGWQLLKCPKCYQRTRTEVLVKDNRNK